MKNPELILFASQPIPGRVMPRLQPGVSPERAADIVAFMVRATATLAVENWPGDVHLYGDPDAECALFRELGAALHVLLAPQAAGDRGQRLSAALQQGIGRRGAAAVMDCDVPHCGDEVLERAHDALARGRNVIGPTMDGGYYLLGLQQYTPELFTGVAWDGDQILEQTLARAQVAGIEFEMLPRLRNVDTLADLVAVAQGYAGLQTFLTPAAGHHRLVNKWRE